MQQRVTRQELHDLAWSEPMRTLAKRFGISDVALAKTCRQMHVPTPPQGYWNKKAAGKPARRLVLPPRPVGLDDTVVMAGGRYARNYQHSITQEEILAPVPPVPTFPETMEAVQTRLEATLPKVPVPRDPGLPHPAVAKLLKRDDEKRERQKSLSYVSTWDAPLYDTPIQRRRLRLLSAIFLTLARKGCRADTWGIRSHAWRIEMKASTLARLEKERAEAERKERERRAALERKRVEDLFGDAVAFRRARDIRAYVEEASAANADAPEPVPPQDMESWARWALAQADRIDPVRTGAFRRQDEK